MPSQLPKILIVTHETDEGMSFDLSVNNVPKFHYDHIDEMAISSDIPVSPVHEKVRKDFFELFLVVDNLLKTVAKPLLDITVDESTPCVLTIGQLRVLAKITRTVVDTIITTERT